MSINKQLKTLSRKLTLIIVGLSVLSALLLTSALLRADTIRLSDPVTPKELHSSVENNDAVVKYLEQEKDFEAHFVTIASVIKQDKQDSIKEALLLTALPVIVIAAGIGFLVARYALRPVKESYESQERFLQDAAHELRNPLAAMSLALENVKGKKTADQDFINIMNRQTKRLVRINEELLFLERRKKGKTIDEINISVLLEDVLEDFRQPVIHKKLKVKTRIQPDVMMKVDSHDFVKLAKNLIENSIKYTKSGKSIEITLKQDKNIEFTVKDQGIGIPEEDLQNIGDRFFRAKNTGKIDGTGLGLAIVNKITNVYGGDVDIQSKVNAGTTVRVTLK